jgi:hypothetical protein
MEDQVYRTPGFRRTLMAGLALLALVPASTLVACSRDRIPLTCDATQIKPASYGLVTHGATLASARQYDFWEQYGVDSPGREIASPDEALAFAAQRAAEVDVTNQMAHAISARELLILGQSAMAEAAWHRVIDNYGSVAWLGAIQGHDGELLVEFNRQDMRLYPREAMRHATAGDETVWAAALGGCLDPHVAPAAIVSWLNVGEIRNDKKGALSFRLIEPVAMSTGGRTRRLDHVDLTLRGVAAPDSVRRTLTKFVDPERRISLPSSN